MKKLPLISLVSFFILIPNINAADYTEETTSKYHYYYFSEPYSNISTIEELKDGGKINYTRFANYREWEIPSAEEVSLSNDTKCENTDKSDEWCLDKFYAMWDALEYGTVVCKGDTCSRDLQETGRNRYYHAHGAYSSSIPYYGDWSGMVTRSDTSYNTTVNINTLKTAGKYSQMACATLQTDNSLYRVNAKGDQISDGTKTDNTDNTYIAIKRQILDSSFNPEISWSETSIGNASNCGDKITAYKGIVYSPALYRVTTKTTIYNCNTGDKDKSGTCNDTVTGSASCGKKTITVTEEGGSADNPETAMAMAVVSFRQDYSMTNILTPTKIYQGGGVKIGFLYNTTVTVNQESIQYDNANGKEGNLQQQINKEIEKSILGKAAIKSNIKNGASNLYLEDENRKQYTINPAQMQVECDQQGDIINDKEVTTTCTILLPESKVELGTGKVTYKNSIGKGINNEFYTPIKYNGDLYLNVKLEDLGTTTELWNPDIKITYNGKINSSSNCTVSTYPRFYEEDNKTYKFIYRPIDLNNPFPNRNAGINWYDWYSDPYNKNRLESSYDKVEYQMKLDNQSVSKIKEYNKDKNYLDWKGINEKTGKSDFVRDYGGDTP